MIYLPQTLIEIAATGGGLIIDLEKQIVLPQTMLQIAAAASHSWSSVVFRIGNSVLSPQTMIQVAAAGRGRVTFDLK